MTVPSNNCSVWSSHHCLSEDIVEDIQCPRVVPKQHVVCDGYQSMVRCMKCYSFVFDLSISVGDWPTFLISKIICKGQMRVNNREISLTAL